MVWGGAEEQAEEILAGNMDAKNWRDEAHKILETTVSHAHHLLNVKTHCLFGNSGVLFLTRTKGLKAEPENKIR